VAGLVAAYELTRRGRDVVVLEAAPCVGGRVCTDHVEGYDIDQGAQFLSSGYPVVLRLLRQLGLEDHIREPSPWTAVVRDGTPVRIRADRPLSPARSGLVGWRSWLRLGWRGMRLGYRAGRLPLNDYSRWERLDTETTAEWSHRHGGTEVLEYLFEPALEALYYQAPEDTSRALMALLAGFGVRRKKPLVLQGGLGVLTAGLASNVRVELETRVRALHAGLGGVRVETDGGAWEADRVILAVPAPEARRLYTPMNPAEEELLATSYSSTINVAVAARSRASIPQPLEDVYGLFIPRSERRVLSAVSIESNKHSGGVPSGELLNAMLSGEAGARLLHAPDHEVLTPVFAELDTYFPGISEDVRFVRLYRWSHAEPMSPVGRSRAIARYRAGFSPERRIALAGDYVGTPFTEGAAESGLWVAAQLAPEP
jgi:protoporphyrinogen/coproporphyrinogen III oxidase